MASQPGRAPNKGERKLAPKPKVVAAGIGGAIVTVLVALGVVVPGSELAAAIATIAAVAAGYLKEG